MACEKGPAAPSPLSRGLEHDPCPFFPAAARVAAAVAKATACFLPPGGRARICAVAREDAWRTNDHWPLDLAT